MEPHEIHNFEQGLSALMETFPHLLFTLYSRLIKEGFNDEQAMAIILKWIDVTFNKAK